MRKSDVVGIQVPEPTPPETAPALPVFRRSTDQTLSEAQRRVEHAVKYRNLADKEKRILGIEQ